MKILLLLVIFLSQSSTVFAFKIPSGLSTDDTKRILDRFGSAFVVKLPQYTESQDELKAYFHGSVSLVETSKISRLGMGSKDTPVNMSLLHFGLQMPFDFDLGLQTSLSFGGQNIQNFGGFIRWHFSQWGPFRLSTTMHGSGVNFDNQMSANLYGVNFGADMQMGEFNFFAGTGPLRATSAFQGQLFNQTGLQPVINLAREYSHQVFRVSVAMDDWTLTGQADWVMDFHSSVILGTQF